jgi:hypothetical protein
MTNNLEKSEKILGIAKNYIIPLVVFICGLAVAWAILDTSVKSNAFAIEKLEVRCAETERTTNLVLQRLSSIDAKLEYIVKEIDSLSSIH